MVFLMPDERKHPSLDIVGTKGAALQGVKAVLCVTGSIAAIEAPEIARELMRHGADVWAVMSPAARKLIHPQALHWATGHEVTTKLTGNIEHISLLQGERVVVLVAPATANTISKIAHGIDDTPVTSVCSVALGLGIRLIIAPAMHEPMYRNVFVLNSLEKLKQSGVTIISPKVEELKAKIPEPEVIVQRVIEVVSGGVLKGKKVVITAGPTIEYIDPVRVITNRSSGLMGFALADEALRLGADVTLILGLTPLKPPPGVRVVNVTTTQQMKDALEESVRQGAHIVLAAAAPADFQPSVTHATKIDTRQISEFDLKLTRTPKVIANIKKARPECLLVAFKAEANSDIQVLAERGRLLMHEVAADLVVANDVSSDEAGFSVPKLKGVLISSKGLTPFEGEKTQVASFILDQVVNLMMR